MSSEVKLSHVDEVLEDLEYPIERSAAIDAVSGVTVLFADGEERLAAVIERSTVDRFESSDDLEAAVFGNLPVEAVGEPGQSEGDG